MADKKYSLKFKKELYYIFLIVVVGGIMLHSFVGPDGYLALKKEQRKVQQQKQRVDKLELGNKEIEESNEALRSDPEAIENKAREQGYGRGNEIIQQLPMNPAEE